MTGDDGSGGGELSEEKLREQSSMRYWWPRLKDVDVPKPETVEVRSAKQEVELGTLPNGDRDYLTCYYPEDMDDVRDAIETVNGPPAFLRTDQASNKHRMEGGSRIESIEDVGQNVWNVVEHNQMAGFFGLPYDRFYVREWLNLYHEYTAFHGTPIATELRFFLYEGDIHSCGFYWPEDAIRWPDDDEWEKKHQWVRDEAFTRGNHSVALKYAERVAEAFPEAYWSVDFALTEGREWYCIDMARGELSWHPDSCEKPPSLHADTGQNEGGQ